MRSKLVRLTVTAMTAAVFLPLTDLNPEPALASSFDLQGAPVLFANGPCDEDGEEAGVGFSHRYDNVVQFGDVSVDALVSLVSTSNLDNDDDYSNGVDNLIDYLDRNSSTNPNALRTQIDIASGPETIDIGEAVIRVAFVQAGTRIPLTLQNAVISVKDVDDSQFVEFAAISSYKLTSDTALQVATNTTNPNLVTAGSTRFLEPAGIGTASTDERNWAEVSYSQLSVIDIKIGAHEAGDAFFDIDFTAVGFTAVTNQVQAAAPSYTVTYDNNGSSETPPAATTGSGTVSIASATNRTNYTFTGWNTATDGTGLDIAAESNLALSANITLYAQWSVTTTTTPTSTSAPTPTTAPTNLDANGVPVLFANGPSDEDIGYGAGVGFSHRYDNVVQIGDVSVDALVSLVSTSNLDCDDNYSDGANNLIDYLDNSSSSFPNALRTQIDIASGPETIDIGEAVIRVAFVQAGTRIPLTLQNAVISVKDVDDSQFVEFAAISSYKLTSDTALQVATNTTNPNLVTAGSTRFLEPAGIGTASTDERNWAEVSYSQLSVIDIKIGAHEAGDAFFDIDFTAVGFTAVTNQVQAAAPSYTVTYDNNGSSETPPAATTGSGTVSIASATNRTDYNFIGWNTTTDGTGLDIAAESNIALSANVTLYAQWAVATSTTTTTTPSATTTTTTSAPTATNTQAPSVTVSVTASLPATGSDTSQLVLVLMGLCLVGVGLASRKVRPRHDSNMRPMD